MATTAPAASLLLETIQSRRARTGVIGLGYVGLPLAVEFARAGYTAVGIDLREVRVVGDEHVIGEDGAKRRRVAQLLGKSRGSRARDKNGRNARGHGPSRVAGKKEPVYRRERADPDDPSAIRNTAITQPAIAR